MNARVLNSAIAAVGLSLAAAGMATTGAVSQAPAPQPAAQPQARGRGAETPANLLGPGPSAARFPRNAEEFDQMFNQIKNWGRWGPNDQLGAANLITDAKRKQALGARQAGHRRRPRASAAHRSGARQHESVRAHDEPRVHDRHVQVSAITATRTATSTRSATSLYKDQTYNGYARDGREHGQGLHEARHREPPQRHRHARRPASTSRA